MTTTTFISNYDLLNKAIKLVRETGLCNAGYLSRKLKIHYTEAARLILELREAGIIGTPPLTGHHSPVIGFEKSGIGAIENPVSVVEALAILGTLPDPQPKRRTISDACIAGKIIHIKISNAYILEKSSLLHWAKNVWKPKPGVRKKE